MPLRGFRLMTVIGVMLLLTGLVLPVVASTIDSYERERAENVVSDIDCTPQLLDEIDIEGGDAEFMSTRPIENECVTQREASLEDEQRDRALLLASALDVVGWALRLGGSIWLLAAAQGRRYSRV